jgi:porin
LPPPAQTPVSPFAAVTAFGQTLKQKGIYLQLGYAEDFSANISGGLKKGFMPTGELFFGTVLDLETLAGIPGASIHVTFDERNGYGINTIVGTQGPLQANSGPSRTIRLSEFYWEQGFDNDRIDIIVGRTNPTFDFATSDVSCQSVSSIICAQPGTWYFSNSNQAYPASTWGGRVNFALTPEVYVRAGAFEDNPSQLRAEQHGFSWGTSGATGVFIPVELGYSTSFSTAPYPTKLDVGAYWDDTDYTEPGAIRRHGRGAYWLQGQQTIWRPNPKTNQSLTVFAGGINYNRGAPYWGQYYAGFLERGPFLSRPDDTILFEGSYYVNNSNQRPNRSSQWIFELNYGFQLTPGITIKPFGQYVVHPNNFLSPIGSRQPDNAWVVGVQVAINAGEFFGFPQFVAH